MTIDPAGHDSAGDVARLIRKTVQAPVRTSSAYQGPPARDGVKLDAMENPYSLPAELRAEWLRTLEEVDLNRYPDASAAGLKTGLREAFGLPSGSSLLLGNGSDEIIQMIQTVVDGPVLAPVPTFVMYGLVARFLGREFVGVPLDDSFSLDMDAMTAAVRRYRPAVVFIAYPNNPTGNLFDEQSIRCLLQAAPGLVVVDEAYHVFAGRTWMDMVDECSNLMVVRTLSKLGLAGLRLGFGVAHPAWIEQLEKVRLPYNVGVLTQASAEFALSHLDVFVRQAGNIKKERGRVRDGLVQAGYECFPSDANFILFRCPAGTADRIFDRLLQHCVLVKNLNGSDPMLAECLRVTIGTPEENGQFLAAIP